MSELKQAVALCRATADNGERAEANCKLKYQQEQISAGAEQANIGIREWWNCDRATNNEQLEIMAYCIEHRDIEYLVVSSPDRIARSATKYRRWERALGSIGVKIMVLPDTPESRFRQAMLMASADYESQMRSKYIKRGIQRRKEQLAKQNTQP